MDSMISQKSSKSQGNQSLFRGLQLIEVLSNYPNGCPLATLAEKASMNKSTVHRILQELQSCGYVTATQTFGSYRLTAKFVAVGQKALSSLNIINVAAPHLEKLNLTTGETVNFSMFEREQAVFIYKLEPTMGMLKTRAYIGQPLSLYCSAMGKIFLAYHPNRKYVDHYWQQNNDLIRQLTVNTITRLEDMHNELSTIRQTAIAYDKEENEIGVSCIALPIFDVAHKVNYSVSISLSTARLQQHDINGITKVLMDAAKAISHELGYYDEYPLLFDM
ncbi:IclR family transcriptional regulator [Orbus mooreae]|uniref:IclR family transcriptional regulator n=1 Tax=Orbus mooreae TaxID=3074107 RepID=UPI00370D15AB